LPEKLESWRQGEGPAPGPPVKPRLSAAASAMWDHLIATCPGRFFPSQGHILKRYCVFVSIFDAKSELAEADPKALTQQHLIEMGIADTKLLALEKELGLTPLAQSKMPVVDTGPKKAKVETRPADIDDHLGKPKAPRKRK